MTPLINRKPDLTPLTLINRKPDLTPLMIIYEFKRIRYLP